MPTVVVAGAGIAGLACARAAADLLPGARVLVLESGERAGGVIASERLRGFTCESGPNGFLNLHPSTVGLAARCGLEAEVVTGCEAVRRRFVLDGGRLKRFPDSPGTFAASDLLGWRAKARMLLEPLVPGRDDREESVGHFARRRLGREAAELIVGPVVSGIYAGDPERLSARAAIPHLAALDGRGKSLLSAFLRARREERGPAGSPAALSRRRLVSLRGGLGTLVDGIASSLGESVRLRTRVERVTRDGDAWIVAAGRDEIRADAVVLATPARHVASCASALDAPLRARLAAVSTAPLAALALGFREADVPHPLDGFGYLVSPRERSSVLGVYWASSMFAGHRAPEGFVLMQAVVGGTRDPLAVERSDDELLGTACEQIERAMGVQAAPVLARVYRHASGLPQYEIGHAAMVAEMDAQLARLPGLFVTGNSFRGLGVNACTADAERTALAVAARLGAGAASQARRGAVEAVTRS